LRLSISSWGRALCSRENAEPNKRVTLVPSLSSPYLFCGSKYRRDKQDGQYRCGRIVSLKVGVDSPKRVRYYFYVTLTFLPIPCYLNRTYWVVGIVLVIISKASCAHE
jgi:hypothetical protein